MSDFSKNCNEAMPIKVNRVFDSCSDKDCVSGVQVNLKKELPESVTLVKTKCITISKVCVSTEPIPFNKGFYSVDITFNFDVELAAYESNCCAPSVICGTASVSKSCILYGSEANTKTFTSEGEVIGSTDKCCCTVNLPTAIVQTVSPIVLESKVAPICGGCECSPSECCNASRGVLLTLGLFYVVELVRPVTIMVKTMPYTIPQKECCSDNADPCEVFGKIKFPVEEFSPGQSPAKNNYECGGGISTLSINPPPLTDNSMEAYDCDCDE